MGTCMAQELKPTSVINNPNEQVNVNGQTTPKVSEVKAEAEQKPQEIVKPVEVQKSQEEASIAIQSAFRQKLARKELEQQKLILEQDKPKDWIEHQECFSVPTLPEIVDKKINREVTNNNRKLPAYVSQTGVKYNGQWKLGVPSGYGQMLKPDGTYLEGQWKQGQLDDGVIVFPNGDIFLGQGQCGVRIYKNGVEYSGDVINGLPHGQGEEKHPDQTIYYGQFLHGKKHGKGEVKFSNGSKYNGEYQHGEIEGQGTFVWADSSSYTGYWKQSMMHGKGTFHYHDGSVYTGDFVEDKKEGQGKIVYADKSSYEGGFHNNKRHGMGKVTTADHQVFDCEWKDGQLVLPPPSQ